MEFSITDLIHSLSYEQLQRLKFELDSNANGLKTIVDKKISDIEVQHRGICVTCGSQLNSRSEIFTLVFGSPDLKQKGSFCGLDCQEAFLSRLRTFRDAKTTTPTREFAEAPSSQS